MIDRSFRFQDRWRWHCIVSTKFAQLEQKLTIEDGSIDEVSKEMSDYLYEMEKKYPSHSQVMGNEAVDKRYVA